MLSEFTLKQHLNMFWNISAKIFPYTLHSVVFASLFVKLLYFLINMVFKLQLGSLDFGDTITNTILVQIIVLMGAYFYVGPRKMCERLKIDLPSEKLSS